MSKHDFGYFFHEGLSNMFSHGFMSFAAIGITVACLLIMGTFTLVAVNADANLKQAEQDNEILAFVDDSYTEAQAKALQKKLEAVDNVASVTFISREEAMQSFISEHPDEEYFQDLDPNILRDRFAIKVKELKLQSQTVELIKAIPGIGGINAYAELTNGFITVRNIATVICLVLAFPIGYFLSRLRVNKQHIMLMLVMLPMWMNFLLRTYAWMTLLEKNGLINKLLGLFGIGPFNMINTSGAVVLGMVYNYLPYMILPLYTAMTKIDNSVVEAAQDLGANVFQILGRVLIPLSKPGIATGITMVFVPAVSTFIISRMLGGGANLLIGDLIELQFLGNSYNLNLGSAMSLVLMVIVLLCMSFTSSFDEEEMEGVM